MKANRRIIFWTGNFWPILGGVEVHATRFLQALTKRGFEFLVISNQNDRSLTLESDFQGIPVFRFPFADALNNPLKTLEIKRDITKLKRSFAPDLIHRNSVGVGDFFHLTTANVHPAPFLVTLHGKWLPQANALVTQTLRAASWVVGCSATILNYGQKLVPEISSQSSIVYNAMEDTGLLPTPLLLHGPRLLCLGRMVAVKGFDLALHAMVSLVKRFPEVRLTLAGDGPERCTLEKQAAELGLRDKVDFLGWVHPDKVPALINTATIVVMPSRFESFPIAALQAAHGGRPVVGTRVGGLPEVVAHSLTGLLVDEENSDELASAITYLLDHPAKAVQMGQAGRTRVKIDFNWKQHIDTYEGLYRKLIENRSQHKSHSLIHGLAN